MSGCNSGEYVAVLAEVRSYSSVVVKEAQKIHDCTCTSSDSCNADDNSWSADVGALALGRRDTVCGAKPLGEAVGVKRCDKQTCHGTEVARR